MTELLPNFDEGLNIGAPISSKKGGIKQSYISLGGKPFIAILGSADAPLRCVLILSRILNQNYLRG